MANSSGPESHKLRQRSSTSPSVLPLMRRYAPGARSSEREGRRPGYCCCSIEDDGNHNARPRLSCVGPAAAREASGGRARVREEGGGAASLTHGSDGGEQQVDDNHDVRPRLGRVGPAAAREASGRQGGRACEEGGGAARLTHGSDGGERQWI